MRRSKTIECWCKSCSPQKALPNGQKSSSTRVKKPRQVRIDFQIPQPGTILIFPDEQGNVWCDPGLGAFWIFVSLRTVVPFKPVRAADRSDRLRSSHQERGLEHGRRAGGGLCRSLMRSIFRIRSWRITISAKANSRGISLRLTKTPTSPQKLKSGLRMVFLKGRSPFGPGDQHGVPGQFF